MILSKQVLVTGDQFTQQHHYHGQFSEGNKAPIDILMEAVAPSAFCDPASFDKPKCHPQMCVKILEEIVRWTLRKGKDGRAGEDFI
ncbi:hypothetical protein D9613_008303 [Agrocybe pediades]|uniref:Uncharacterized protein n=1 Tax=Agrocybe pediades TaxID=84607 RepID=A0A8H4QSX8_9AGAR|nr:hypothetical protein D9613_008303 [Agrocybe pediades]